MSHVRMRGLAKSFGSVHAVRELNLDIERGELLAVLGPSGCGKTTLLRMIAGFEQPDAGCVVVSDEVVAGPGRMVPPEKRRVGMVFQDYALFPHMTVGDNVAFGLRMEGLSKHEIDRRVDEYLDLVNLAEYRDRYPTQMSGGQAQRVALARALAKRPAVLLLDEPLGALDLKLRKQMQVELARIHRQVGTTFVFVTHDQEEALSMATRIAVMSGGRVRQIGPPREIYLHPVDRFVADFIGESNFLDGILTNGGGAPAFQLPDGTMLPASVGAAAPAGPVKLMVRPESVSIGTNAPQNGVPTAVVKGRTANVAFMGSHTRITVQTDAGTLVAIRFRESDERATEEEMVDREVHVWWDPRESTVVAAGDESQPQETAGGGTSG
jgi:spermidine/putrescine ABC transporter ATP-binding subunit